MNSGNLEVKEVEFEDVNHVNIKLIDSELKILKSQNDINSIYKIINANNPSLKKILFQLLMRMKLTLFCNLKLNNQTSRFLRFQKATKI